MSDLCMVPPAGWWCSREPGHEGPCAARPIDTPSGHAYNCDWHCDQLEHECNCAPGLLRQQHAAMGDVMMLRRLSACQDQRDMAQRAIAVWQRVAAFLAQVGRNPEGQDPQGLGAEHEHVVPAGDAPEPSTPPTPSQGA